MGTDDDNIGNAKYFRMLRTYGFPYTMNVEAENINHSLGSDVDDSIFTSSDAPALFTSSVTALELGKYLHDNNLGEVAQHGASEYTLWDSNKLTGTFFDNLYASYTSQGGTKTQDELKDAIKEQLKKSDVQQGASYVEESREELEEVYGFAINTVGLWGGSPTAVVDGITLNLNSIKGGDYDWQGNNYYGASTKVATWHINETSYDISRMNDGSKDMTEYIDLLPCGKAVEFFWHVPFNDRQNVRGLMESLKALEDAGKIEVVTRYQYAMLGEYVTNPITSITVTRDGKITEGESDDLSKYTVTARYQDGSSAVVNSEAIIDNSALDTSKAGLYTVAATYRGFNATTSVVVESSGGSDFVDYTLYSGYAMSKGNVTADSGGYGIYVFPIEPGTTYYLNASAKSGNHIIGYTDKETPVKLDVLTDGAQIKSWSNVVNYEVTNPSGKAYLYYYYSASSANTVTLSKMMV